MPRSRGFFIGMLEGSIANKEGNDAPAYFVAKLIPNVEPITTPKHKSILISFDLSK